MSEVVASVEADAQSDEASSRRLGAYMRQLRKARGLTLVQLAGETELSHPFLSQLERGLAQPSLGSLRRIALALETSPIELIAAADAPAAGAPQIEVNHQHGESVPEGFAAGTARMLAHSNRPFHPMEVFSDATAPADHFVHAEDEFAYVLEGAVMIDLDGQLQRLEPGDTAYYCGGVSHRWWSADGGAFRLLIVKQGFAFRPDGGQE
ncbi:transcriptional regulator with XRE-family HTH domain [Microbacterium endophyticum]|uniref:Transcriptional regulator with XRE-family HTH domain n=1 Tax=Microbacterium endophyticum TaxID=1526412 RepID=A0A7W4V5L2_9MICO|nr:XRE family transcriptional regulator [Microbacterium endophyticum]MBB2977129.1 transcriptional regulator with XRE-family HTH domain [Microbacterium endophyticum]NIK36057.1 transcriptional regulator with XRE-family HTH domain [Microbacterium endophyticum]